MNIFKIESTLIEILGRFIRLSGKTEFSGKSRLFWFWIANRDRGPKRTRILPGGNIVLCDFAIDYEAMVWLRQEEQRDLEILRCLLKNEETFVDCGANIGIWTLVAASRVGKNGQIYAFEPNPIAFKKLAFNVSQQKINRGNIKLFNLAIGDSNRKLPFKCNAQHNLSQIVTEGDTDSILVPVITLNNFFHKNEPINGIKIDVEGFELNVLKGAEGLLKRCSPWLCVEFNTQIAGVNRLGDWNVYQYLRQLNYRCYKFKDTLHASDKTVLSDNWKFTGCCNLYFSIK